jgi:hypothetical protein
MPALGEPLVYLLGPINIGAGLTGEDVRQHDLHERPVRYAEQHIQCTTYMAAIP